MGNENYDVFIIFMLIAAQSIEANQIPFDSLSMLKLHNDYRLKHGAPPVILDDKMSAEILEHLYVYKDTVEFKSNKYGVNAFWKEDTSTSTSSSTGVSAETAFLSWYEEGKNYDYSKEPKDIKKTRHFTQLLWKKTERVGILITYVGSETVVVVTYDPKGNIERKFTENVKPPGTPLKLN